MPTTTIAAAAAIAAAPIAPGVTSAVTTIIETAVMMTRVRARIPPAAAVAATGVALRSARPPRFATSFGQGPNERHDDTDREQTENEEHKPLHACV